MQGMKQDAGEVLYEHDEGELNGIETVGLWLCRVRKPALADRERVISELEGTDSSMDVTVELKERVLTSVLDAAGTVFGQELTADADPIAAGFDSIAALQLAAALEEELGVPCSLEDVFDAPSFAALADVLAQRIDAASDG